MSVRETERQTREGEISREVETVRVRECQRDRQTDGQTHRETERQTVRQTHIQR